MFEDEVETPLLLNPDTLFEQGFVFFLKSVDFKLFILPGEKFNLSITFYCMITLRSHFKNAVAAMA